MKKRILIRVILVTIIIVALFFSLTTKLIKDEPRYYKVRTITIYAEEHEEEKKVSLWRSTGFFRGHNDLGIIYKNDEYYIAETAHRGDYKIVYDDKVYHAFTLLRRGYLENEDLIRIRYPMNIQEIGTS
ncbi:hypothetical protein RI065_04115 [Mycoplasmatota bacterium zrk1]